MTADFSAEQLAQFVNDWCDQHRVYPANGQTGERLTVRSIRYYRTLGLVDPPMSGGGRGYGDKHRLQLMAIRLLQARGLPLGRIQELLFGRGIEDLKEIESRGLDELAANTIAPFQPSNSEMWNMTPLNEEFMLVSRKGRGVSPELRERLRTLLESEQRQLKTKG